MDNEKKENPQEAFNFLKKYGLIDGKEDSITALKKYVQQPIDQCTEELKNGAKTINLWDLILKVIFGIAKIITGQEQRQQKTEAPKISVCPNGFIFSAKEGFSITDAEIKKLLSLQNGDVPLQSGISLKAHNCLGYIEPSGKFIAVTKKGFPYDPPPGSKIVMRTIDGYNKEKLSIKSTLQNLAIIENLAKQQKDEAAANPTQEGASEEHSATEAQQNTETQTSEQTAKADETPANPMQEAASETQSPKPEEASVQKMSSEENSQASEHAAESTEKTSDSMASAVDSKTQADNQPAKKPAKPEVRASSFDVKAENPVQEFMYKRAQQQLEEAQKMDTYNNSSTEMYGPENWRENWVRDQQKKSEMFSSWQETIDKINNERLSSQQAPETQEQNTMQPGM